MMCLVAVSYLLHALEPNRNVQLVSSGASGGSVIAQAAYTDPCTVCV